MNWVITFPDYKGQGDEFAAQLRKIYPDATIVPILNGPDTPALYEAKKRMNYEGFYPLIVKGQGLLPATLEGYDLISKRFASATIVKIDTAEHPINMIGMLAQRAEAIGGFAVGDLVFDETTLVVGTPDWYVHLHTFPIMYGLATKGKLTLSCAHGFQAFAPGVCAEALVGAHKILAEVERQQGSMPRFGLDGTMAISCSAQDIAVERIEVPAISLRNREPNKIDEQTKAHFTICMAAAKVFF